MGLEIFAHLFPGVDFSKPKHYFKIRPGEKTPSARVSWHGGYVRITDFGDQGRINGMKAIPYLMLHNNLDFHNALLYIEDVILHKRVDGGKFKSKEFRPGYEMKHASKDDNPGDYSFVFKSKADQSDLQAIGRYITGEVLKKYNCKVVAEYSYCAFSKEHNRNVLHCFKATENYPIFLFDYGDFKKLYRPHEEKKKYRFIYIGEKPSYCVFGLQQIIDADNEFISSNDEENPTDPPAHKPGAIVKEIFRCTGESDALNLASLGYHVYWLNSESAKLTYEQFKEVDDLCERHYQIMDLDYTGRTHALKNALRFYNLYSIEIPAWIQKWDDWRGNGCKDLKDYINIAGEKKGYTEEQFSVLKANARRIKFWEKIVEKKKVFYNINMEFFYFFLKANGFYQMESIYHKKAGYCYVHIQDKVVHLIHPDNIKRIIKRFTKEWIQKKHIKEGIKLLNKINTSNQISENNLETIEEIKIEFCSHDMFNEYIHFKGGSLHITHNGIKQVRHEQVPNYILGSLEVNKKTISHVCDHEIRLAGKSPIEVNPSPEYQELLEKLNKVKSPDQRETINALISQIDDVDRYQITINDPDFIFIQFLQDLANIHWRKQYERKEELTDFEKKEQDLVLANLLFVLGYHCRQYKDPGRPWITFLQDMKISEIGEASGRSGKSLLSKAPTFVRASFYKGGRALDNQNAYQFFYDGFTEFHDYIEVDDLAEYAEINWFYTQITGQREINPKNYAPFILDYKNSGKMLISSNYELPNVSSSTVARMLNAGVSDYYHEATRYNDYKETRTPFGKFGRLIYDDFTEEEWNKFYNLMAYCIQMNMRFHKIQPPMMNLLKRQARRVMTQGLGRDEVFFSWANDYFLPYKDDVVPKPEVSPEEVGYLNTYVLKDVAFEKFIERLSSKQKSDYRITKFKKHVEAWCEYWGYEFNPTNISGCGENRRILKTVDKQTRECFYISTFNIQTNGLPSAEEQEIAPEVVDQEDEPPF